MPISATPVDEHGGKSYNPSYMDERSGVTGTAIPRAKFNAVPKLSNVINLFIDGAEPISIDLDLVPENLKHPNGRDTDEYHSALIEWHRSGGRTAMSRPPQPEIKNKTSSKLDAAVFNAITGVEKKTKIRKPKEDRQMPDQNINMQQPTTPVTFSGDFGEFQTYFFDAKVDEPKKFIILVWNTEYRGNKYTPPVRKGDAKPFDVTIAGKSYPVYNIDLRFTLETHKLELLLLFIARDEIED